MSRHFVYDEASQQVVEVVAAPRKPDAAMPYFDDSHPRESLSMRANPSQIPLLNAALKEHNITGVHYDPTRRINCVVTNDRERDRAMKVIGPMLGMGPLHDEDSFR
jgi:hypothetical protein